MIALGVAQTLAWGSTYYLPAILAHAMAPARHHDRVDLPVLRRAALVRVLVPRGQAIDVLVVARLPVSNLLFARVAFLAFLQEWLPCLPRLLIASA